MNANMNIEERIALSLALKRYQRALERFEDASKEFNEACSAVRTTVKGGLGMRKVVNIEHNFYVFQCDNEGNFSLEQVESL
jgi:hypothetical protein